MNVIRPPKAKPEAPKIQMPKNDISPLCCHPIPGEMLRFHVDSSKAGEPAYLVDLESYDFSGECGCDQFAFRCRPILEDKTRTLVGPIRCKHILAARECFIENHLRQVSKLANTQI